MKVTKVMENNGSKPPSYYYANPNLVIQKLRARCQALNDEQEQLLERIDLLELTNRRLKQLVAIDELTGAFNRRHFNKLFETSLSLHRRDAPLALCLFDLDNFKAYNDFYGHPAGDTVLREVATAIRGKLRRTSDSLSRLGGEEFGVLFSAESADKACAFVTQLQQVVTDLAIPHACNPPGIVTASFGTVWWNAHDEQRLGADQIYATVDTLLYDAKAAGRNRSVIDELGHAFNRCHVGPAFDAALARHHRADPLAFCVVEIDNFKAFSHLNGPETIDKALRAITHVVQVRLRRASDTMLQTGSEQFSMLFSASSPAMAEQFVEHMRAAVSALGIPHPGHPLGVVTASFRIVWLGAEEMTADQMTQTVNSLLHRPRKSVLNQVSLEML